MRILIIAIILLVFGNVVAQNTVNQLDAQGRKQGYWSKKDADGKLLYQATFKDDQPIGELKRYHPNGKLNAILNFVEGSEISDAQLFDEKGQLIARGKYSGQKKNGEWNYFLNSKVISTETYLKGQKNGLGRRFYKTGELLEESSWKDDKLNGLYRSYFQDGKIYLECSYQNGQRNGSFKTWFSDGTVELDAYYSNDFRDKDWNYFDSTGKIKYKLKYDSGKLLNPEIQDSIDAVQLGSFKFRENNIPDPEKFMQNPEEYMKMMKIR